MPASAPSPPPGSRSPSSAPSSAAPGSAPRARAWIALAFLAWAVALVAVLARLPSAGIPGWDEAGHAFAALRMADPLRNLELGAFWTAFHRPDTYTGPGRLWMVPAFWLSSSFDAPRIATVVVWFAVIALAARLAGGLLERGRAEVGFWTVAFGVTSWLGIEYARTAFQEAWCALWLVAGLAAWGRARAANGGGARAWLAGLTVGGAFVVKANYGLALAAALAAAELLEPLARRVERRRNGGPAAGQAAQPDESERRADRRRRVGLAGGAALVLAWWYVLPLPAGFDVAAGHREYLVRFLTNNAEHASYGPGYLLVVWPLMACLSLLAFALQFGGLVAGLARWREPLPRATALLFLAGLGAFAAYPLRIDRFLLPFLPAAWMLGAAWTVLLVERAGRRGAASAVAVRVALVAAAALSIGRGQLFLSRLSGVARPWTPAVEAIVRERGERWSRPFAARPVPNAAPPGIAEVLELAVEHVAPAEPFLWIGGTRTELSLWLVEWRLWQASRERALLVRERDALKRDHFWSELAHADGTPFDELDFRAFASAYPQVVVLDPPDPRGRPEPFEERYAAWMASHPAFERAVAEQVELAPPPARAGDPPLLLNLHIYARRPPSGR